MFVSDFLKKLFSIPEKPSVPVSDPLIYVPEKKIPESYIVREISLTGTQATEQGFSFRKKSKSVRITNYHGNAKELVLPSYIDGKKVNEIQKEAFLDSSVERLEIPSTVRKIGVKAFSGKNLKSCLFADGLTKIPNAVFLSCIQLTEVHLPNTLCVIGENAFYNCSALEYIAFPGSLYEIGKDAFYATNLSGFSYGDNFHPKNGQAFTCTPLYRNYALILNDSNPYQLKVMLVGCKANSFDVPECRSIYFFQNAFIENNRVSLDLTKCGDVAFYQAFDITYTNIYFNSHNQQIRLYFPENYSKRLHFPYYAVGYVGHTAKELPNFVEKVSNTEYLVHDGRMLNRTDFFYMTGGCTVRAKNQNLLYEIAPQTFDDFRLESLTLCLQFHAKEPIFSEYCGVREVSWYEDNRKITKYIPYPIGRKLRKEILSAFRDTPDGTHFFDSQVILQIFQRNPGIHTRERILLAIDVLRGIERENVDCGSEIYHAYLKRHWEQAWKVCRKIQEHFPEYLEFLNQFSEK